MGSWLLLIGFVVLVVGGLVVAGRVREREIQQGSFAREPRLQTDQNGIPRADTDDVHNRLVAIEAALDRINEKQVGFVAGVFMIAIGIIASSVICFLLFWMAIGAGLFAANAAR